MYRYKRRSQSQDDQHLDRWLVSYADYMTLMFALFVVLYALALSREGSLADLTRYLGDLFHAEQTSRAEPNPSSGILLEKSQDTLYGEGLVEDGGVELVDAKSEIVNLRKQYEGTSLSNLENDFNEALQELINSGFADVEREDDWLVLSLSSNLLFASGSATASHNLELLLPTIAKVLAPADNFVRVRGYTDSAPINNELFSSNWELSSARAAEVLEGLVKRGIRGDLLAVEAYGSNFPRGDNATAEGRAANRRVEIAISRWGSPIEQDEAEVVEEPVVTPDESDDTLSDYDKVQIIQLPGGGIRITTRRDPTIEQQPESEQ